MKLYFEVFKKFNDFYGKASRSEFYSFVLINILVMVVFGVALVSVGNLFAIKVLNTLLGLYLVATVLPSIALIMRRLNDLGRSRRWVLVLLVPIVGLAYLLWVCMQVGNVTQGTSHRCSA